MISLAKLLERGTGSGTRSRGEGGDEGVAFTSTLPVLEVVLVRSLVVFVIALAVLAHDRESPLGRPPCHPVLLCRGLLGAGAVISMFYAVSLLPLVDVLVASFTMPLWGAVFGRIFLGEAFTRTTGAGLLVCGAGVILLAQPWSRSSMANTDGEPAFPHRTFGVLVAAGQAALSAGAKTCVRLLGKSGYHAQVIVIYLTVFGSGLSAFVLFAFQGGALLPALWQWGVLLVTGILAFVGQTTSTMALRSISVPESAMVNYLNLVWGELYSVCSFGELPTRSSIAGAGLIVLCTFGLLLSKR